MLKTLIESRVRRQVSVSHVWVSISVHAAVFYFLLTSVAPPEPVYQGRIKQIPIQYAIQRPARFVAHDTRGIESVSPKLEKLTPIPTEEIDQQGLDEKLKLDLESLHLAATESHDGSADGVRGGHGTGNGPVYALGLGDGEVAVIRPIAAEYPPDLLRSYIGGEVTVMGIIDTDGKVEPESFRVLRSTDARFDASVRKAFTMSRYIPARVNGIFVRVMVCQHFGFSAGSWGATSLAESVDCPAPRLDNDS